MSSWNELRAINDAYAPRCPEFHVNAASGPLAALNFFYSYGLWIATYVIGLYSGDFYFFLLSWWLTLDYAFNYALAFTLKQPPRYAGCGPTYEMPSYASEQMTLVVSALFLYVVVFNYRLDASRSVLLTWLLGSVMYARIYIGISTPLQLVVGSALGALSSCVFSALVYFVVLPHIDAVLSLRVCRWFNWTRGMLVLARYEDTPHEP